jgi:predicted HAD superfamily Cof-like phosphohydrolase
MTEDKEKLAVLLFEAIDGLMVTNQAGVDVDLNKILDGQQKYSIVMAIVAKLPKNGHEMVVDFHNKFKVRREDTHIVTEFHSAKLRFMLLMEEVLELGQALGFGNAALYRYFTEAYKKVVETPQEASLTNVLDALTDILFVAYGAVDVFNLAPIQHEAMDEVYTSNMSKLIPVTGAEIGIAKESRAELSKQGFNTVTNDLKNGYFSITNIESGKILKPVTYFKPNLNKIINNHLNKK